MNFKTLTLGCAVILASSTALAGAQNVDLHWLDGSPAIAQGVSWGVPWAQGKIQKDQTFALRDASSKEVAVQSWPLAYWPDGSIKWTGFAATGTSDLGSAVQIVPGASPAQPQSPIKVEQTDDAITIHDGPEDWQIGRKGADLIRTISLNNQVVVRSGRLVGQVEDRSQWETKHTLTVRDFLGDISSAVVESAGPERVVVKIEGKHRFVSQDRTWLPFIVRLYFYAGSPSVRMMHTFIFDGDQEKDFIRGLGVRFDVPMREQFQNRHVRLAGDVGLFAEPVQLIAGRREPDPAMYQRQIGGQRIPNLDQLPLPQNVKQMAVWNDFKLTQLSPDGYEIDKRTNPQSAWIRATGGRRSPGLAFVGDVSGGLAVDLKDFWQLYPTELEINNAGKDVAQLTVWLWSPDAPAMDMRHYDTIAHGLEASYEDVQPGMSSAYGVARTSELTLRPYSDVPSEADLWEACEADQRPPMLVCTPKYFHDLAVFGLWSLPDRSTPRRQHLEDQLDRAIAFYQGQIDQRWWYGFWDYGDFMHTFDTARHEWRYDVGGFAWDNTELAPNVWLWYSFLRSGRADIYRMAEALTRQSQEVDVYHIGPWKGLGSRHNVRHWGDGAKELRISQCLFKRFYYYLTTDERMGDLMNEEINADQALLAVDPLRELPGIAEEHKYPTHMRIGPDWLAMVSNWYTAWERTGDVKYRDWIMAGINSILAMPGKIASGENYGYDPKTHTLHQLTNDGRTPSLLPLFGGPEFMTEIIPVLNDPAWTAAWVDYCQHHARHEPDNARLTAYAAYMTHNGSEGKQAWEQLMRFPMKFDWHEVTGPVVPEKIEQIDNISTNSTSQWCLNVIEMLQLVPGQLPGM